MRIISQPIHRNELKAMLPGYFGDMIKAVVDIQKNIIGLDAELHADIEKELLQQGSEQADLWGINLYPEMEGEDFDIEVYRKPSKNFNGKDFLTCKLI